MKLVVATHNPHKLKEIRAILADCRIDITSLVEFPHAPEVEEDGNTFEANAVKKAAELAAFTDCPCLADDSGLVVDALNGVPGVHSKRFGGPTDADRNQKLLELMKNVPAERRTARFICVAALCWPDGGHKLFPGVCEGSIGFEPRGDTGFGYDPIFIVPEYQRTYAELGPDIKNRISHRAKAFQSVREWLTTNLALT